MGYFDKLAENNFKTSPEGETVFFANGVFGKGRLVPDEETRQRLFAYQKNQYKLCFLVFLPYVWLISTFGVINAVSFIPIVLFLVYALYKQLSLTKGLPKHHLKLGFKEAARNGSRALPNWYYWTLGIISLSVIAMAALLPVLCNKPFSALMLPLFVCVTIGVAGILLAVKMYQMKNAPV